MPWTGRDGEGEREGKVLRGRVRVVWRELWAVDWVGEWCVPWRFR